MRSKSLAASGGTETASTRDDRLAAMTHTEYYGPCRGVNRAPDVPGPQAKLKHGHGLLGRRLALSQTGGGAGSQRPFGRHPDGEAIALRSIESVGHART